MAAQAAGLDPSGAVTSASDRISRDEAAPSAVPAATTPATGRLAGRLGRFGSIYAAASMMGLVFGLANIAVFTRFLEPAQFGHLTVLLVFSTVLTLLYNLGSLPGTISWVHGRTADEDAEHIDDEQRGTTASDPRRALTTGIVFTVAVGLTGTVIVYAAASPFAALLIEDAHDGRQLVALASLAAATAAIWRLAVNVLRLQRRAIAYLVSSTLHHGVGLVAAVPLLAAGLGLVGVLGGIATGNALASVYTLVALRRDLRPAVSLLDLRQILTRGKALVPVALSFHVLNLGDVLMAARLLSPGQIGLYRVGARIGSVTTYWASAFQMAWGPLRRDPIHAAADAELGRGRVNAVVTTYWVIITSGLLLALALFADELVRIAAPEYRKAADLIPLAGVACAMHGLYVLVYRTSEFPSLRRWFIALSVACAVAFVIAGILLITPLGIYGPAVAIMIGWSVGIVTLYLRAQLGPTPTPYQYSRIAATLAVAGALYAASLTLPVEGALATVADGALLLAYPLLLAATGIVPRYHRAVARSVIRAKLMEMRAERRQVHRLRDLNVADIALVDLLVRKRVPPAKLAEITQTDERELLRRFVRALRMLGNEPAREHEADPELGAHLVRTGPPSQRDNEARELFNRGVDPLECDRLRRLVERLERASREVWEEAQRTASQEKPSHRAVTPA